MKTNIEIRIISKVSQHFSEELLREVRELRNTLKKIGMNIDNMLREPFSKNQPVKTQVYYSIDSGKYFFVFNKSFEDEFLFMSVRGNPMPIPVFDINGSAGKATFINYELESSYKKFKIDYSFLISQKDFSNRLNNIKELAVEIVKLSIDSYKYQKQTDKQQYLYYLDNVKSKMEEMFFDESVGELAIDKFIEENPVIIEHGLSLTKPMHQVILKNILHKYEHDLKPDLIAFDLREKNWVIVDYKKAKRNIIKNLNKVRTGFRSEVHDLESQLLDYVQYFQEDKHREYVSNTYQVNIDYPRGIGIIGNVSANEQVAFSRLTMNKPKWFSVIPYNYLYDNFCRYVELVRNQLR